MYDEVIWEVYELVARWAKDPEVDLVPLLDAAKRADEGRYTAAFKAGLVSEVDPRKP